MAFPPAAAVASAVHPHPQNWLRPPTPQPRPPPLPPRPHRSPRAGTCPTGSRARRQRGGRGTHRRRRRCRSRRPPGPEGTYAKAGTSLTGPSITGASEKAHMTKAAFPRVHATRPIMRKTSLSARIPNREKNAVPMPWPGRQGGRERGEIHGAQSSNDWETSMMMMMMMSERHYSRGPRLLRSLVVQPRANPSHGFKQHKPPARRRLS